MPKKDRDYHTFGKFCHRVLEWFHQQYIDGCLLPYNTTMTDAFKVAWSEFKDNMTPEMKKECWEILNQYLKIISKDKRSGLPANVINVEKKFDFQISDNLVLNGAIDRIQLDADNVLHVADYKTTKHKKYLKNDWFQLLTYAHVILKDNPSIEKVRASYILLRHDFEYITTEFSKNEILAVKEKYEVYSKQILEEKEFPPTTSNLCNFCDYLDSCPAGKSKAFNQNVYGEVAW
jgi:RecB family exonuclease